VESLAHLAGPVVEAYPLGVIIDRGAVKPASALTPKETAV
jgi:hypothetical protein